MKKEAIQKNKITKIINNEMLFKIYYLLYIMPFGLPYSFIKLIYPNLEDCLEENKMNILIYQDNDNWYNINEIEDLKKEISSKDKDNIKKECISNCLKVYSRLLYFYIENNSCPAMSKPARLRSNDAMLRRRISVVRPVFASMPRATRWA